MRAVHRKDTEIFLRSFGLLATITLINDLFNGMDNLDKMI